MLAVEARLSWEASLIVGGGLLLLGIVGYFKYGKSTQRRFISANQSSIICVLAGIAFVVIGLATAH